MDDLLNMNMDQISELISRPPHHRNNGRTVNAFDHYEVSVAKLETVFITEDLKEAMIVYTEECNSQVPHAVLHVKGRNRTVIVTNAPFMYPMVSNKPQLPTRKEEVKN